MAGGTQMKLLHILRQSRTFPTLGADKNIFNHVPKCFFVHYNEIFVKQVLCNILTNEDIVYLIGGNPKIVWILLNWLYYIKEGTFSEQTDPSSNIKDRMTKDKLFFMCLCSTGIKRNRMELYYQDIWSSLYYLEQSNLLSSPIFSTMANMMSSQIPVFHVSLHSGWENIHQSVASSSIVKWPKLDCPILTRVPERFRLCCRTKMVKLFQNYSLINYYDYITEYFVTSWSPDEVLRILSQWKLPNSKANNYITWIITI